MTRPGAPGEPGGARLRALVGSVDAPAALHARIAAHRERIAARRARRGALAAGGAAVAVLAALAAVLVVVLAPSRPPAVLDAVALAGRGPEAPAPPRASSDPGDLARAVDGVAFPAWSGDLPWRATGERRDALDGREAATVYYEGPRGARVAYTIVGGGALDSPEGSRRVVRRGVEIWLLRRPGGAVATWREGGRQCVISASASVPDDVLLGLAASSASRSSPGYG